MNNHDNFVKKEDLANNKNSENLANIIVDYDLIIPKFDYKKIDNVSDLKFKDFVVILCTTTANSVEKFSSSNLLSARKKEKPKIKLDKKFYHVVTHFGIFLF